MDINALSQTTQSANTGTSESTETTPSTQGLSSDFETFLRMLTVQMENQDPLNPIESADFAVQLATFSSVEQQVKTNDLLTSLANSMSGGGLSTLGQWVGMEVRGAPKALFAGTPIDLAVPTIEGSDRRQLVVANESGQTVARVDLDLTSEMAAWDGQLATGTSAANGAYSFRVEGYKTGQIIGSEQAQTYGRVLEARIDASGAILQLEGDIALRSEEVTALRQPTAIEPL